MEDFHFCFMGPQAGVSLRICFHLHITVSAVLCVRLHVNFSHWSCQPVS